MRITLVAIHTYPSPQAIPLGTAFLQSYFSSRPGHEACRITLLDLFASQDMHDCVQQILADEPDAVGLSMYLWNREMCREIARNLQARRPELRIFAGGPEVTADPAGVLSEMPLEFAIAGEGEIPFSAAMLRMTAGRTLEDIPGIATRDADGRLRLIPARPLPDLDDIPSPWLTNTIDSRRYSGILWQLSRGCGFTCDFCYDSRGIHGVRRFSLERLEAELRHFAATGVAQVFVLDSTFNQDRERAKSILRMIGKIAPRIHFHFEVRSEFIDREMARLFAAISCSLQIGLQSADPAVMKGVGRTFSPGDFTARIGLLNRSGAVFGFDLIYGLPGDTWGGFLHSIDFALGLYPNHLDIFPLSILPGTALAKRAGALGLKHLAAPPYTMLSSPSFSSADMARAAELVNACTIFYTRGKGVAWFNSICAALGLRPSALVAQFADWLKATRGATVNEADLGDNDIWQLQRNFLMKAFGAGKRNRLLPLVLDLVDYHHHYAMALLTPPSPSSAGKKLKGKRLLAVPARLAPATQLTRFNYEILDILEAGEPELVGFTNHHPRCGSWAVIYPRNGTIFTESLIEPYYRLLEQLDGMTGCGQIAARLNIPADEAISFLDFAVSEDLIITVS